MQISVVCAIAEIQASGKQAVKQTQLKQSWKLLHEIFLD